KVPALLNTPAGATAAVRVASDWASKTAPSRLLKAAPASRRNWPVPVQVVVPARLSVMPLRGLMLAPLRLSGPLRLKGLPERAPPVQLTAAPAAVASTAPPPETGEPAAVRAAPAPHARRPAPAPAP